MKRFVFSWKEWGLVTLGTALTAAGLAWFADPLGLVTGGITGGAIVISQLWEILFGYALPLSVLNIALNIPVFILSGVQQGFAFLRKSFIGMIFLTLWLIVFESVQNPLNVGDDIFLGTLLSGVFMGVGLALVLQTGATTGGTDMLAACMHRIIPHIRLSTHLFIIDAAVIVAGMFVFGVRCTIYAIVSVYLSTALINNILGGLRFAKAVWILSDKTELISQAIFRELDRGNTALHSKGMYSQQETNTLFVVVLPRELPLLKNLVREIDPKAFVTVCSAQEVLGEGFEEGYAPAGKPRKKR